MSAEQTIASLIPQEHWLALHAAIERATDPDQPLVGLADNLTALLEAANKALTEAVQVGPRSDG